MSHHHVPSWDGTPQTWETFNIEVDIFCKQEPSWKEPQQIAKLLGALKNQAKDLHAALSESERDKIISKEIFKEYLRGHLLETSIPELGRNLRSWQKLKRLPREGMRLYILRHRQLLSKLEKSVNETDVSRQMRVKLRSLIDAAKAKTVMSERAERLKAEARAKKRSPTPSHYSERAPSELGGSQGSERSENVQRTWATSRNRPRVRKEEVDPDAGDWDEGNEEGWNWKESSNWWSKGWTGKEQVKEVPTVAKDRLEELAECLAEVELALQVADKEHLGAKLTELISSKWRESLFPDNLLGYHLLAGSHLTATERSTILSSTSAHAHLPISTGNSDTLPAPSIGLAVVERALLTSWQDRELGERDEHEGRKSNKHFSGKKKAFAVGDESSDTEDEGVNAAESETDTDAEINEIDEYSDPEEQEEYANALARKFESKGNFKKSKRTFVQAKEYVRDLRKNRLNRKATGRGAGALALFEKKKKLQNLKSSMPRSQSFSSSRPPNSQPRLCFRCGLPGHEIKDCTKAAPNGSAKMIEGSADFVMMVNSDNEQFTDRPCAGNRQELITDNIQVTSPVNTLNIPTTNPTKPPALVFGSAILGPLFPSLDRPLVENMGKKSSSEDESNSDSEGKSENDSEEPPQGERRKPAAPPAKPVDSVALKIQILEKTNAERRKKLEQEEKLRMLEAEAKMLERREAELRGSVQKPAKKDKGRKRREHRSKKAERGRKRSRSQTQENRGLSRTRRQRDTARGSRQAPSPSPTRSATRQRRGRSEKQERRSVKRERTETPENDASPLTPWTAAIPRSKVQAAPPHRIAPRTPERKESSKNIQLIPAPPKNPPPEWMASSADTWSPRAWKRWRLSQAKDEDLTKVDGYEKPVEADSWIRSRPERTPLSKKERAQQMLRQVTRMRRKVWRQRRFGTTTMKRKVHMTEKGNRNRSRILQVAKWPRAASKSSQQPLDLISDTEFLTLYHQAQLEIHQADRENRSIQVCIMAHGEMVPFPSDRLESSDARQRSPSPGIMSDTAVGNYNPGHDYGVQFEAEDPDSGEEQPQEEKIAVKKNPGLPTGLTDEEQEDSKDMFPGTLTEKLLGPIAVKKEEDSDKVADDSAHGVWEEGGDAIFKVDNFHNAIGIVIDPGATATLLKVEDAQALYGKGYLNQVECSQKKFRVANGGAMFASTEGILTIPGLPGAKAYIIEPSDTQVLPISLLGSVHLAGQVLDMSQENPRLGTVGLKRLANGHLVLLIH